MKDISKELEQKIKTDIENVFFKILEKNNFILPISSKARGGAEISDYLEDEFVEWVSKNTHEYISNAKGAPKGSTKSPYDFCFDYSYDDYNFKDLFWGDIKAIKRSFSDSNPDLGTPEKIIKFIMDGHFYLLFVFLNTNQQKITKHNSFRLMMGNMFIVNS